MLIRYTALENTHREPVKMSLKRKGVIAPHDHRLHPQRRQTEGAHALRTCRPRAGEGQPRGRNSRSAASHAAPVGARHGSSGKCASSKSLLMTGALRGPREEDRGAAGPTRRADTGPIHET